MLHRLRHPRINAFLLGVAQGLPQGLSVERLAPFAQSGSGQDWPLVAAFGVLAPPVGIALSFRLRGYRYPHWWTALSRYLDLYQMLAWTGLSLGLSSLHTLRSNGIPGGTMFSAFFISAAFGFMAASVVSKRMSARSPRG